MPDQHREFYAHLPFLVLGSVDATDQPWASIVIGEIGFIQSPDNRSLVIHAVPMPGDPLNETLHPGSEIGILGIDLNSRRRNRMAGKVSSIYANRIEVTVSQAFGNCPQYIQQRELMYDGAVHSTTAEILRGPNLSPDDRELITRSDTFFIASHYSSGHDHSSDGADVSHRGGRPGFVRVDHDGAMTFPDFSGNNHFNTLGNIALNPKIGLIFIDFKTGDRLYISGQATIIWEGAELDAFEGAQRLVRVKTTERIRVDGGLPLRWSLEKMSPFVESTGIWSEVEQQRIAEAERNTYRPFVVKRIERESDTIKSFYLKPNDNAGFAHFGPGQFLPIRVNIPGQDAHVIRTYTLSDASGKGYYRLSIKREPALDDFVAPGLVSNFFHDTIQVGSVIEAMAPRGRFVLDTSNERPVVLLSAGVGITPMIAMLNDLSHRVLCCGEKRDVWFIHGARNSREQAFRGYLKEFSSAYPHIHTRIRYSDPAPGDAIGVTHDSEGRVDIELIKEILPFDDYEFYLCGPPPFMKSIYEGLIGLNVSAERIHYEFFGPATVMAPNQQTSINKSLHQGKKISVSFLRSGIEAEWNTSTGTLLELAEQHGIEAPYSCRSGACGTCSVKVITGAVEYFDPPIAIPEPDCALICSAKPGSNCDEIVLDL